MLKVAALVLTLGHFAFAVNTQRDYGQNSNRDFQSVAADQLNKLSIDQDSEDGWDKWIAFGSDRQPEVPSFDKDGERGWDQWVAKGADRGFEDIASAQLERIARQSNDYSNRDFQSVAADQLNKLSIDQDSEDGWDKWIAFGSDRQPEVPSFDKDGERGWDQWLAKGADRGFEDIAAAQLERITRQSNDYSNRDFQSVAEGQLDKILIDEDAEDGWDKWIAFGSDRQPEVPSFDKDGERGWDQWVAKGADRGFEDIASAQLERIARQSNDYSNRDFQSVAADQLNKLSIDQDSEDGWDKWVAFGSDRQPEVPSFDKDGERGWDQWLAKGADRGFEDIAAAQLERIARQSNDYSNRDFQSVAEGQLDKILIDEYAEDGWDKWIAFGSDRQPEVPSFDKDGERGWDQWVAKGADRGFEDIAAAQLERIARQSNDYSNRDFQSVAADQLNKLSIDQDAEDEWDKWIAFGSDRQSEVPSFQ